jgi:hypothetical protein
MRNAHLISIRKEGVNYGNCLHDTFFAFWETTSEHTITIPAWLMDELAKLGIVYLNIYLDADSTRYLISLENAAKHPPLGDSIIIDKRAFSRRTRYFNPGRIGG